MEMEHGKLFIGGISWDTNEERLKDYFQTFGEVIEAVIMKDRTTGRARGFGFVVFSDPAVAERVVKEKHIIDGRTVEAKKAVPRDDQQSLNRSSGSIQGSPGPIRTKKIFAGGLASSVTESDFKNYFEQFGLITDVVVMYDHNTQRPRGFGFITFDSEESVDKALLRTFHELNGKMVEVKRAVPKQDSSPSPNRNSPITGFNYGSASRVNSLLNYGLSPEYNSPSYGSRMDGRFSPVSVGRSGYPPFSPSSYNVGLSPSSLLGMSYSGTGNGNGNFGSNLGYGREYNPMFSAPPNRFSDPIGYGIGAGGGGNASVLNSTNHNMWGNGSQNFIKDSPNLSNFLAHGNGSGENGAIWGNSNTGQGGRGGGNASFNASNLNYGNEENTIGYRRNNVNVNSIPPAYSFDVVDDDADIGGGNLFGNASGGASFFADSTWRASSPDLLEVPDLFGYNLGTGASDGLPKNTVGYVGYNVTNRSNRGIAA